MRRAVALVVVALAVSIPSFGSVPSVDPIAMLTRLSHAEGLALNGALAPSSNAMQQVRDGIGLPVSVVLPAGELALPQDAFLQTLAGNSSDDFYLAANRISSLEQELHAAAGLGPIDEAKVNRDLAAAYRGIDARPGLLQRILAWVGRHVGRIINSLVTNRGLPTAIAWVVLLVALGIIVWMLTRVRWNVGRLEAVERVRLERPEAVDWRSMADAALARGDVAMAVRYEFILLLESLADAEIISADTSVTAGECRTAVNRVAPTLEAAVGAAVSVFERVAYGGEAPDLRAVDVVRSAIATVRRFELAGAA